MTFVTIGEFAQRTRLSPKGLRLYDELGLVVPARVDASNGYRHYSVGQVPAAQLVGLLRRLGMPLALISSVLRMAPDEPSFLTFYGEVSEDSDGPVELSRPVTPDTPDSAVDGRPGVRQVFIVDSSTSQPELLGLDLTISLR